MKKRKALWHGLACVSTILLGVSITVANLTESFRSTLDSVLGTTSSKYVTDETDDTSNSVFTPPKEYLNADGTGNSHALIAGGIDLGRRIEAEGAVLLKNENDALPLATGKNVTLLGARSHKTILGASMGGSISGGIISLETALGTGNSTEFRNTAYQVSGVGKASRLDEFEVKTAGYHLNPTMIAAYEATTGKIGFTAGNTNQGEVKLSDLAAVDADYQESFKSYNDAAVIVIGRGGSEGSDYSKTGLALTEDEKALIDLAKTSKVFKKIIVLINSANPVEIDELKNDAAIDAVMWIGLPGSYGTLGVADVLTGAVNPSGGLSDTFAAKVASAPSTVNFGDYTYSNADAITRTYKTTNPKYVIEAEGIYTGYKYYETRYYDCVLNQGNADSTVGAVASSSNWNYDQEVSYAFGYGLSYTEFKKSVSVKEIKLGTNSAVIDLQVEVENTGDTDGKTSVQIYGQAPYTQGGLEKSAVQLVAFEKVAVKAGETKTIDVSVDMQNIATYDENHVNDDGSKGSYVLEDGDYYFAVGNGAHEAVNNILAKEGKTPENTDRRMDAEGDAGAVVKLNRTKNNIAEDTFAKSKTGAQVQNQISYIDWNYYEPNKVTYLSRSDWAGTWPKEYTDMTIPQSMLSDLNGNYYTVKDNEASTTTWNSKETNIQFYEMTGLDYDDPKWDSLLSQMTLEEGMYVGAFGGTIFPGAETIGLKEMYLADNAGTGIAFTLASTKNPSAPWALTSEDNNGNWKGAIFGCSPLIASTFNHDLIVEQGEYIGVESLFVGISILWGPGLNTHRTAYCGRNNEYYSEDAVLSGECAASFSYGALNYGLIAAPKHFAFNDQETNRQGVSPFMTEQSARENELRAYQLAIESTRYDEFDAEGNKTKDVAMIGLMISFSKVGAVECTCSRGLLTEILRNEWGFHGYAVTDIYDDNDLFASIVYAGSTGYDMRGLEGYYSGTKLSTFGTQHDGTVLSADSFDGDATLQAALRASNHDLLWAFSQSNVMNSYSASTKTVWLLTWWRGAYIAAISVSGIATITFTVLYAVEVVKKRKEEKTHA